MPATRRLFRVTAKLPLPPVRYNRPKEVFCHDRTLPGKRDTLRTTMQYSTISRGVAIGALPIFSSVLCSFFRRTKADTAIIRFPGTGLYEAVARAAPAHSRVAVTGRIPASSLPAAPAFFGSRSMERTQSRRRVTAFSFFPDPGQETQSGTRRSIVYGQYPSRSCVIGGSTRGGGATGDSDNSRSKGARTHLSDSTMEAYEQR